MFNASEMKLIAWQLAWLDPDPLQLASATQCENQLNHGAIVTETLS